MHWLLASIPLCAMLIAGIVWTSPGDVTGRKIQVQDPSPNSEASDGGRPKSTPLLIACAVSNRPLMEQLSVAFEKQSGWSVNLRLGPSHSLLSDLEFERDADLFLPADDWYVDQADQRGWIQTRAAIAHMKPVLVTRKANIEAAKAAVLENLIRGNLGLSLPSSDTAATGRLLSQRLRPRSLWTSLSSHASIKRTSAGEVLSDVVSGAADVGIVLQPLVHAANTKDFQVVESKQLETAGGILSVGILTKSRHPEIGDAFLQFMQSDPAAKQALLQHGYLLLAPETLAEIPSRTTAESF
ncbi:MAG: substrate-binding domain-containing protein [Planctomycetota bacterium]